MLSYLPGTHRVVVTVPLILALVGFVLPWPHHFSWSLGARLHFTNWVHPTFLISLLPTLAFFYSILFAVFSNFLEEAFGTLVSIVFLYFILFSLSERVVSCSSCWPQTHSVAKEDFKFLILLPPPLSCWSGSCAQPRLVYVMLRSKSQTPRMSGKHSTNELDP